MSFDPEEWDVVLGTASEHVAIHIQGPLVPEATHYWDRNALDRSFDRCVSFSLDEFRRPFGSAFGPSRNSES